MTIPQVSIIGGIESGKTTTIQYLWENNVIDYKNQEGTLIFDVSEMLEGREMTDFRIIELPRINYTNDNWIKKDNISYFLETSDIIIYTITCDEISINARKKYMEKLFSSLQLKKNVVILIAYGMADWVLVPDSAHKLEVDKNELISLDSVSNIIKKTNSLYEEFSFIKLYDNSFSINSVIPYSNILEWNLDWLKYQIWDGLVLALNSNIYDNTIPTVVLSGKTGCGKTSTINSLWNKNLATNRTVSCTKFPTVMHIEDEFLGHQIKFNLVDLPGIAESMQANTLYKKFYDNFISKANVLVCLSQADRRAYSQDQLFYSDLISNNILTKDQNIILAINQADLLFKSVEHPNGVDLNSIDENDIILKEKAEDYYTCLYQDIFSNLKNITKDSVVIYSVFQNWHLNILKEKIYNLLQNGNINF